jgi:hypothetical protein
MRDTQGRLFDVAALSGGGERSGGRCGQCERDLVTYRTQSGQLHRGCAVCGLLLTSADGLLWTIISQGRHVRCGVIMCDPETPGGMMTRRCGKCAKGIQDWYGGEAK